MEALGQLMNQRFSRADLKVGTPYYAHRNNIQTYVGTFVRSYRMGSGDGMTIHAEFLCRGKPIHIDDEMWGNLDADQLTWFTEAPLDV